MRIVLALAILATLTAPALAQVYHDIPGPIGEDVQRSTPITIGEDVQRSTPITIGEDVQRSTPITIGEDVQRSTPIPRAAFKTTDMTTKLTNDAGHPIKDMSQVTPEDPKCEKCGDATIGGAINIVLDGSYPDERDLSLSQRVARALLADRLKNNSVATLKPEERALIEKLLPKAAANGGGFSNRVLAQIVLAIDPQAAVEDVKP